MSLQKNIKPTENVMIEESNEFVEISDDIIKPVEQKDSKIIFETIKVSQPKPLVYSWLLKILIFLGILSCILVGSLALGNAFLEFHRPDFVEENNIGRNQSRRNEFGNFNQRQYPIEKRIMAISVEFIVIAGLVILGAFLIYRNTDGILVKNKVILVSVIVLVTVLLGIVASLIFSQNTSIPRAIREKRDGLRGLKDFRHQPKKDIIDQSQINSNN
jgi:hypothetical protein